MHVFFRDVSVYKRKEFFTVSDKDINGFFYIIEGKCPEHEGSDKWSFALDLARK